jgi:hypothetical protein
MAKYAMCCTTLLPCKSMLASCSSSSTSPTHAGKALMRLQLTLLLLLVLAGASWALPQCSPNVVNLNTDKMVLAVIGGG